MTAVIASADAPIDHDDLVRQYWGPDYQDPAELITNADRPTYDGRLLLVSVVVGAVMYGGLLLALLSMGSVISGVVQDFGALGAVML